MDSSQPTHPRVQRSSILRTQVALLLVSFAIYGFVGARPETRLAHFICAYAFLLALLGWLVCLLAFGLLQLRRWFQIRWNLRRGLPAPALPSRAATRFVHRAALVPLDLFLLALWIWLIHQRALSSARDHAELLIAEMQRFHAATGAFPGSLAELPSGAELPLFAGRFEYGGTGPSSLVVLADEDPLTGGVAWTFDPTTKEWRSKQRPS